ncbi:MAG TPA: PEP-CTERM sorting domain-containing protein [Phycisphaerales bacterium]|nr:PEP-CTERM sorting domain-containing protein [Phycisphaerales bacterium]
MTKIAIFAAAGMAVSATASADLTGATHTNILTAGQYTLTATPLDAPDFSGILGTAYSNMDPGPNGYVAFAAAGGAIGFDDYDSIATGGNIDLQSYRFVGGVDVAGGVAFFEFYDASSNFVDSFGVAFPQSGNFIWTITISGFPGAISVPDAGIHQIVTDAAGSFGPAAQGQWFLGDAGPTVGSEDNTFGGTGDGTFSHNFEINGDFIPAPASLALLGLGGIAAVRRRR